MPDPKAPIFKSPGFTDTERFLFDLCDRTFLKLWSYPNPFRAPGKELCDLIAVFDRHVFLFFDRSHSGFERQQIDVMLTWKRWKKEAIDKQIKSARKAVRHVRQNRADIFLDSKCQIPLPIAIPQGDITIHLIVVAHGATEACKAFSPDNVSGSLAVAYSDNLAAWDKSGASSFPFLVALPRDEIVHVFDTYAVQIIFRELDTVYDLSAYLSAKETAIRRFEMLSYAGEEDLLAYYYRNFDEAARQHVIDVGNPACNLLHVGEGLWQTFVISSVYRRKHETDQISYMWDRLLQVTSQNALSGTLTGDGGVFEGKSAIHEMAKEPRFSRRALAEMMHAAIMNFPKTTEGSVRNLSFMPSFFESTGYVFLQVRFLRGPSYEGKERNLRRRMLEIACAAAKNHVPHLTKVVGIAIDAPQFAGGRNSEDFVLLNCEDWPDHVRDLYEEENRELRFFRTDTLKEQRRTVQNFPDPVAKPTL
jgi:hypothetical protein